MEWALHVKAVQEIRNLDLPGAELRSHWPSSIDPVQAESRRIVEELFGRVTFSRIYLGNEFCEHLIPSARLLRKVCSAAAETHLSFTLLTPYVTDQGIDRLRRLFSLLAARRSGAEVVANDWGVLQLLRREFPALTPVLGRLLNKMLRDPQATAYYSRHPLLPKQALSALRQSNLTIPVYRAFLRRSGIRMVEVDNLIQGLDVDFRRFTFAGGLYVPYGFVATGRICLFASLSQPKEKKFTVAQSCSKECQRHYAECMSDDPPFKGQRFVLLHRGNTVFYSHPKDRLRAALLEAEAQGITRIIYQPQIPM